MKNRQKKGTESLKTHNRLKVITDKSNHNKRKTRKNRMKQQNHRSAASGSVDRTRGLQDRPAIIKTIKPEKCESRGRKKRKVSQLISVLNCDRNLKIMASGTHRFDEDGFMAERAPVQRYRQF